MNIEPKISLATLVALALMAAMPCARAQTPKVGDITVGMTPAEIDPVIRKRGLNLGGPTKAEIVYTLPNGQRVVLPNSEHIASLHFSQRSTQRDGEIVDVQLSPFGGREKAVIIERHLDLGMPGAHPTPDAVLQNLEKAYGKPTHFYRDTASRHTLKWIWDAQGTLQPPRRTMSVPCTGNRGTSSAQDDPRGECGALALTVSLQDGSTASGPGVGSIQSRLVDYRAIRANEIEMRQRLDADAKRAVEEGRKRDRDTQIKL